MNKCNVHTILRLPTGIFYAQGVKTNVLFFTKGLKRIRYRMKTVPLKLGSMTYVPICQVLVSVHHLLKRI